MDYFNYFWALIVVVALLSMQGQIALGFLQNDLNLCSEDEQRSYWFGTTWGWVINALMTEFSFWGKLSLLHCLTVILPNNYLINYAILSPNLGLSIFRQLVFFQIPQFFLVLIAGLIYLSWCTKYFVIILPAFTKWGTDAQSMRTMTSKFQKETKKPVLT